MKNLFLILSILFCLNSFSAELLSPFPSFVNGLNIPNADEVGTSSKVYRGMAPREMVNELSDFGFTDILIFKRQTRTEVDEERQQLLNLGFKPERIHYIPFNWKQYRSITQACEQTLQALSLLVQIKNSKDRKIYFHCTMGEDRTGHLAGLYRLLTEKTTIEEIYQDELCSHGFAEGNKQKPADIASLVNGELKGLFLALAEKIEKGEITQAKIFKRFCSNLETTYKKELFKCL